MADIVTDLAAALRKRAGLVKPAYSTKRVLDIWFPSAIVIGHDLPPSIDEAVSRTSDHIVILYRRDLSLCDRRFAIGHAIGHLMFDAVSDVPMHRGRGGDPACEERADAFAAELLVPLGDLERYAWIGLEPDGATEMRNAYLDHVDQLASIFTANSSLIDQRLRQLIERLESG